jgi:hypothetical protein
VSTTDALPLVLLIALPSTVSQIVWVNVVLMSTSVGAFLTI